MRNSGGARRTGESEGVQLGLIRVPERISRIPRPRSAAGRSALRLRGGLYVPLRDERFLHRLGHPGDSPSVFDNSVGATVRTLEVPAWPLKSMERVGWSNGHDDQLLLAAETAGLMASLDPQQAQHQ